MVLGRNFGQIMFNVVKKVKKQALSLGFFSYFVEYLLKQKVVVAKPPECKFKVWVQVGSKKKKKVFFRTSHLSVNPVLLKNEVVNSHSVLTL